MPSQSTRFKIIATLFVIALFALLAYKGLCYYEDGEDPFFTMLYRGEFTGGPQNVPNSLGGWIGLTYLFVYLFKVQNNFDWYGAAMLLSYSLLIIQLGFILPVIYNHAKKTGPGWFTWLLVITSALLFCEHFFMWQLTRVSLLLSGISIFRIIQSITGKENVYAFKWRSNIFNIACFAFAALIRPEPPALNLVVWLPMVGLGILNGIPLKKYLVLAFPALIIIGISQILSTPFNQIDRDYLEFRKYQFSLFDFQQPVSSLNIADAKDSIIFAACRKPFFADDKHINSAFFKRIGVLPLDKTVSSIPYYFKNLSSAPSKIKLGLQKLLAWNPGLAFLYLLYLFAGIVLIASQSPKNLLWYLLSQLFLILLCICITALMKMENRVLVPLIWCFILQNLMWCGNLVPDSYRTTHKSTIVFVFMGILISAAFYLDASKAINRWEMKKTEQAAIRKLVAEINAMPEKIVVVNGNTLAKLYNQPFDVKQRFKQKRPIIIENFMLYWLPGYRPYMQSICGSSSIDDIIKFLSLNKNDVLILGQPEKMNLLTGYFKIIYGLDIHFEIQDTGNPATGSRIKTRLNRNTLYRII